MATQSDSPAVVKCAMDVARDVIAGRITMRDAKTVVAAVRIVDQARPAGDDLPTGDD